MSRYTGAKCRQCRREGLKLFLKGERCNTHKCSITRREYPPGMHLWRRGKVSEYAIHLREKQKMKRYYGILESEFRNIFARALRQKGNTGENLVKLLERRLDHALVLSGLASSHAQARQLVTHGHIMIGHRRVSKPSYRVSAGEVIRANKREKSQKEVKEILEITREREVPAWLQVDREALEVNVLRLPEREEIGVPAQEQLVVEFASR